MVNAAQPNACSIPSVKSFGVNSGQTGNTKSITAGRVCILQSLYMPAMVALKHNLIIKAFGLRLKKTGMAPKAVISALMHKLVRLIYGVLKTGIPFNAKFAHPQLDFQDGI